MSPWDRKVYSNLFGSQLPRYKIASSTVVLLRSPLMARPLSTPTCCMIHCIALSSSPSALTAFSPSTSKTVLSSIQLGIAAESITFPLWINFIAFIAILVLLDRSLRIWSHGHLADSSSLSRLLLCLMVTLASASERVSLRVSVIVLPLSSI